MNRSPTLTFQIKARASDCTVARKVELKCFGGGGRGERINDGGGGRRMEGSMWLGQSTSWDLNDGNRAV